MERSALSRLQEKLRLSDGLAIAVAAIGSIGGLVLLFVAARLVIDWLEVLAAH